MELEAPPPLHGKIHLKIPILLLEPFPPQYLYHYILMTLMTMKTMMTISSLITLMFARKFGVVPKQVGGYLTKCARIAVSIALN